jgi:hypothetical protein
MTFQKELKLFLKDLIRMFPEDRDMKVFSSTLNVALADDDESIRDEFAKILKPLEPLIKEHDDAFFVEAEKIDIDVPIFEKIHTYWETLKDEDKTIVWDYITRLYGLSTSFV